MRLEIDGKFYRMRRGRLVEIPPEWLNKVTTPCTIRQRPSKVSKKIRPDRNGNGRMRDSKDRDVFDIDELLEEK